MATRDHRSVGYRVPKEWATLPEAQRGRGSLAAFKRESRGGGSWLGTGGSGARWLGVGCVGRIAVFHSAGNRRYEARCCYLS